MMKIASQVSYKMDEYSNAMVLKALSMSKYDLR